jgi:phage FluMu protein Com
MPTVHRSRAADARCECGSLLARLTPRGVELKCRRCKRIVVIPLANAPAADVERTPPKNR